MTDYMGITPTVFSLSGGTGSGLVLDIAYNLRHWISPAELLQSSAYLVLPRAFSRLGDRVVANAYVALSELNHYSRSTTRFETQYSTSPGDRILHKDEISTDTRNVEIQLTGLEPDQLAPDLLIIPVLNHTKAQTVLLYKNKFLFTSDHLAWSNSINQLAGFVCWYSWSKLIKLTRQANYLFEWVLPGHGRCYHTAPEDNAPAITARYCLEGVRRLDVIAL